MLSIDSMKGRSDVKYAFLTVAVLLLVTSVVLAYDYSKATGGGDNDTAREVEQYGDNQFIDASGEAKLIYTVVSEPEGGVYGTVKIMDMERDPRSSSFTTFPDGISYNGNTYTVIGNTVTSNDEGKTYSDDQGVIYTLSSDDYTATITGYTNGDSPASVIFPATVTDGTTTYTVIGTVMDPKTVFQSANITDLTVLVSYTGYRIGNDFLDSNKILNSVKFIVDNDDPSKDARLTIYTEAFENCINLETLSLPNIIGVSKIVNETYVSPFRGCTNLKSASSDEPFLINTKVVFDDMVTDSYPSLFSGCKGIEYLELGKNVNDVSVFGPSKWKDTAWEYTGCPNLKIVYNTSTEISESTIARAIAEGSSTKVLLFNNPGGEFTQTATLSGENITMPKGTLDGIDIPVWSHKDGITMYNSGNDYASFSPWSDLTREYSYYYYALYGSCTVTYHVTYKDTDNTVLTDTRTQTVACMYNTALYDKEDYGKAGDTIYDKMTNVTDLKWTSAIYLVAPAITYEFGQSVTLFCDLVMYLYLDGIESKNIKITYKWDYIDISASTPKVKTYVYEPDAVTSGEVKTVSTDFDNNAKCGDTVLKDDTVAVAYFRTSGSSFDRWSAPDGTCNYSGHSYYFYENVTLVAKKTNWWYIYYVDALNGEIVNRPGLWYIERGATNMILPNIFFTRDGYYFDCWNDKVDGSGNSYYPGQIITTDDNRFVAIWKELEVKDNKKVIPVEYNYNYGESTKSETKYPEYDSSECLADNVFTPPTGYKLIGWSYSKDGNVNFSLDTPVTMLNHLKLYAVWEKVSVPLWVIVDDLLLSADELPDKYDTAYTVIGTLSSGDKVVLTVTYDTDPDPPTAVGVYTMKVACRVENSSGSDVSENYEIAVISESFLTIYRGDHASVTD